MTAAATLVAEHGLPASYLDIVDRFWRPLARDIADCRMQAGRPVVIGVNGAQGSGKSTVCDFLARSLLPGMGLRAATLSLDDLYLTRSDREGLARDVHPLLITRGVPGTHEVGLGVDLLNRVTSGQHDEILLPRFDKRADDRVAVDVWPDLTLPVDVFLFEGWCVGARPQAVEALAAPVNALERDEDADGRWRHYVNDALARSYQALFAPLDLLVMLLPPSFEAVAANRALQERKLAASGRKGRVMDAPALDRFMLHYERLTRHMFAEMPDRCDILFRLDDSQRPLGIERPRAGL